MPTNPSWLDLMLVILIVLYTVYCAVTARRTQQQMISGVLTRGRFYFESMWPQWSAVLILAVIWWLTGRPADHLGLATGFSGVLSSAWGIGAWAVTLLYSSYLLFQVWAVGRSAETRQKIRQQTGKLDFMLPRTPGQLWGFSGLGLTAAICEELIYRGFLLWWCQAALGLDLVMAATVSTLLFGLGHAYQGWQGILRTGLMGAVLMAVRLAAGSLWPAMVLHAAGDLLVGWLVYRALPEGDGTAPTPTSGSSASLDPENAARARS